MDERELRALLDYDSGHLHVPVAAELVSRARRRRTRRRALVAAVATAGVVTAAVLVPAWRGTTAPSSSELVVASAAPVSPSPSAARSHVVTPDRGEANAACRRALTARGVLHGSEGHDVVLGLGAAWLVQVWPEAPSDVPDGQTPPGPLWECAVGYSADLSDLLVVRDVQRVPAPVAVDLDTTDAYACSVVEHALDDLRYPVGRTPAQLDDVVTLNLPRLQRYAARSGVADVRAAGQALGPGTEGWAEFLYTCEVHGYGRTGPGQRPAPTS